MNDYIVYCKEDCGYTKCARNKKKAGPNATYVGVEQFIGCHVRTYGKDGIFLPVKPTCEKTK